MKLIVRGGVVASCCSMYRALVFSLSTCLACSEVTANESDAATDAGKKKTFDAAALDASPVEDASQLDSSGGLLPCDAGRPCFAAPTVLSSGENPPPLHIAVDSTNVYWHSEHAVTECAIVECNQAPTTLWSSNDFYVLGVAAALGSAYFTAGMQYVADCASSGCNDKPTNLLSTLDTGFYGFATDGQSIFWAGTNAVQSCALGGCNESPYTYATPPNVQGVGVDENYVAWGQEDTFVAVCPKSGCVNGVPIVLASNILDVGAITVANGIVYWIEQGQPNGGRNVPITQMTNGHVSACAATGCNGLPTTLATYPLWMGGGAIAADANGVYWSTEDISGVFGEIVGCPTSGCNGAPRVYGVTQSIPNKRTPTPGVAIDATNVYWSDQGLGAVLMTPR